MGEPSDHARKARPRPGAAATPLAAAAVPAGPISNAELNSLRAAPVPAETRLLYYVPTGKNGSHTSTTNLAESLAASKKSKRMLWRDRSTASVNETTARTTPGECR